jgi:predicted  nucleic acid-binding Zn-ribbon protein
LVVYGVILDLETALKRQDDLKDQVKKLEKRNRNLEERNRELEEDGENMKNNISNNLHSFSSIFTFVIRKIRRRTRKDGESNKRKTTGSHKV